MELNAYNTIAFALFFIALPFIVKMAELKNQRENVTFEQWAGSVVRELIINKHS
jgi:hypothetical protein